jgi:hypothetical protein
MDMSSDNAINIAQIAVLREASQTGDDTHNFQKIALRHCLMRRSGYGFAKHIIPADIVPAQYPKDER